MQGPWAPLAGGECWEGGMLPMSQPSPEAEREQRKNYFHPSPPALSSLLILGGRMQLKTRTGRSLNPTESAHQGTEPSGECRRVNPGGGDGGQEGAENSHHFSLMELQPGDQHRAEFHEAQVQTKRAKKQLSESP